MCVLKVSRIFVKAKKSNKQEFVATAKLDG